MIGSRARIVRRSLELLTGSCLGLLCALAPAPARANPDVADIDLSAPPAADLACDRVSSTAPATTEPPDVRYRHGFRLFKCGQYADSAKLFLELLPQLDDLRGHAQLAFALAQSYRFLGDFPSALYYYAVADCDFERAGVTDDAYRKSIPRSLAILANNLAVVTIAMPASGRANGVFGSVSVDGQPPVAIRGELQEGLASAMSLPAGSSSDQRATLISALASGFLAGVERPKTQSRPAIFGPAASLVLVLSRSRDHTVVLSRTISTARGTEQRAAELSIKSTDLRQGKHDVSLAAKPATLRLELAPKPTGELRAWAFSTRNSDLPPWPLGSQPTELPSGDYEVSVDAVGFETATVGVTLFPAEARKEPVELKKPKSFWLSPLAITLYVVTGVVLSAATVAIANDAAETERKPVNGGTLGWVIDVP